MDKLTICIISDDQQAEEIDVWPGYCPPRVGDYVIAKLSFRLVTRVLWENSRVVSVFVSNPLQGE